MKMSKDGSTIITGSWFSSADNITYAGSAYIFKEISGIWSQSSQLFENTPKFLDFYGFSTDINRDGTVVVIGVNGDDLPEIVGSNDNNYGSSIVYNYNAVSNSWSLDSKLIASDYDSFNQLKFGNSVCINDDGDRIAIGSKGDNANSNYDGAIYIFRKENGIWVEKQKITTDTPSIGNSSTAIFSNDVVFNSTGSNLFSTAMITDNGSTTIYAILDILLYNSIIGFFLFFNYISNI